MTLKLMNFAIKNLPSVGATNIRNRYNQPNYLYFKINNHPLYAVLGSDNGIRIMTVPKHEGEIIFFGKRDISSLKGKPLYNYLISFLNGYARSYRSKAKSYQLYK